MAIILASSRCAICNEKLDRPFTATSGGTFPREHPLWRFCDAPLHFDCLEAWPHRVEFSQAYYENALQRHTSGYGYLLRKETDWILVTGPRLANSFPYFVEVRLREWPFRLYSRWHEWDQFVAGEFRKNLVSQALQASTQIMGEVAQIAPDLHSLTRLFEQKALIST